MNNILFGIIGLLMLGIVGVGAYDVSLRQRDVSSTSSVAQEIPQNSSTQNAPNDSTASVSQTSRSDDDEEDDDSSGGVSAGTPTPTNSSKSTTPAVTTTSQAAGTYTLKQIAQHNSAANCWSAVNGGVYDLTSWIKQHPGGSAAILSMCGIDASAAYNAQHGGQGRPANELAGFKIGTLAQ